MKLELKNRALGFALGICAVLLIGAANDPARERPGPLGRYQVSTGASIAVIVDTATGEAWAYPSPDFLKQKKQ